MIARILAIFMLLGLAFLGGCTLILFLAIAQ